GLTAGTSNVEGGAVAREGTSSSEGEVTSAGSPFGAVVGCLLSSAFWMTREESSFFFDRPGRAKAAPSATLKPARARTASALTRRPNVAFRGALGTGNGGGGTALRGSGGGWRVMDGRAWLLGGRFCTGIPPLPGSSPRQRGVCRAA